MIDDAVLLDGWCVVGRVLDIGEKPVRLEVSWNIASETRDLVSV
jgi:hypothetical protein